MKANKEEVNKINLWFSIDRHSIYIHGSDVLFGPYVIDMLTDSDNKYSPKLAVMVDSLIVAAVLFPRYWIWKKMVGQK